MPKLTDKIGMEMTAHRLLRCHCSKPADVQAQTQAFLETCVRSSFAQLEQRLRERLTRILDAADLPSDPEKSYLVTTDRTWTAIENGMDLGTKLESARLPLNVAVGYCGYPTDSREGYAATMLMLLRTARVQLLAGLTDEAMATVFAAGELVGGAARKDVFEQDFWPGEQVPAWGQLAGSQQRPHKSGEKAARREAYLKAFNEQRAQGASKMEAYALVARKYGVSAVTIRRKVSDQSSASD